ncbi:MAG: potassium transporter [Hydrocarboniphaga sp.]|uniref:monovalent cation:proton antiporter-2 (CPA2) family protein n=1 Tax=Hydrocarboniphaga sp. TaxID=2033016 RepID=UPI00261BA096|nr:monovalent cation:proton antiporter-2 (CPA2) family protein [Hydrocarboniphaga sp.]MDB5972857.1 potassium transporter [Hydrocarboniphaga sp.]
MLLDIALFLAAAVLFVPLFKRLGLGAVLGYLAAGVCIGPWGLGLISDVESILHFSEFGVVLLLFIIGLELQPTRLWRLRSAVFGSGGLQVLLTTIALAGIALAAGLSPSTALIAGFGLAMSSTAFVLQMLAERGELTTRHGRGAFAILLFQDLSIIPFLALVPVLAIGEGAHAASGQSTTLSVAMAVAAVVLTVLGGRYALRPLLRALAKIQVAEIFTAAALLVVIATALAMDAVGLSMSLGAFLAGVLLADSEYRHELQADIEPFKGLLLGLFFIAVGMSANVGLFAEHPLQVLAVVAGLIVVKAAVIFVVGRLFGMPADSSRSLALALAQGGEFAFVLFGVAVGAGLLDPALQDLLVLSVTLSMMLAPLIYMVHARMRPEIAPPPFDEIDIEAAPVVIAGFGPFGQIVGRILRMRRIRYSVLDKNADNVAFLRRLGIPVFYSDASRFEVLRAAHTGDARLLVVAISDPAESRRVVETARHHYPTLTIIAIARTRQHALDLLDMGVKSVVRRSYFSSLEATRKVLLALGESETLVERTISTFRRHDEKTLLRQLAGSRDEQSLLQAAREANRELEELFDSDAEAAPMVDELAKKRVA